MELNKQSIKKEIKKDIDQTKLILEQLQKELHKYADSFSEEKIKYYQNLSNENNKDSNLNYIKLSEEARKTYIAYSPFPAYKEQFKNAFSINAKYLKWFIDKDEIIAEVNKINNKGKVYIHCSTVLILYYQWYLPSKITRTIYKAFDFERDYDGDVRSLPEVGIKQSEQNFNNRQKKGSLYFKDKYEEEAFNNLKILKGANIEEVFGVPYNKFIVSFFSGKTESIFLPLLYKKAIKIDDISENQKLELFFDLFRIMSKDKRFKTETEFLQSDALYSNSYKIFKQNTMRKFIYKK